MTMTFEKTRKNLINRFANDGCVDAGHALDCKGWFLRFKNGRAQLDHNIPTDAALGWANGEALTSQEQQEYTVTEEQWQQLKDGKISLMEIANENRNGKK